MNCNTRHHRNRVSRQFPRNPLREFPQLEPLTTTSQALPLYRRYSLLWGLATYMQLEYIHVNPMSSSPQIDYTPELVQHEPSNGSFHRPQIDRSHNPIQRERQDVSSTPPQAQNGRRPPEQDRSVDSTLVFAVDSLFVAESFQICCAHRHNFKEVFHYAAGIRLNPTAYAIARILQVEFSEQSAAGVRAEDTSNIEAFLKLERLGLPLAAHFHSHPGFGPEANHPSHIDRAFQERLERGGAIAIGGIFSRDGYLRFFAGQGRSFRMKVYGNNVVPCGENLFHVSDIA